MTPNDVLEQEKKNEANSKATCQFVRNESVNGEAAAVYSTSRETENAKESGQDVDLEVHWTGTAKRS